MVVDDTLSMRIYSFIDNILIIKTIKEIKQKIDFTVFCARHLGLIVTAVTINGFTPVIDDHDESWLRSKAIKKLIFHTGNGIPESFTSWFYKIRWENVTVCLGSRSFFFIVYWSRCSFRYMSTWQRTSRLGSSISLLAFPKAKIRWS